MKDLSTKIKISSVLAWTGISLLIIRLWFLQVLSGSYYRDKSENNRVRAIRTEPARGVIYDRDGKILVRNRPSFNLELMLEDVSDVDQTLKDVSKIINRDQEKLISDFKSSPRARRFEPQVALYDISHQDLARIEARSYSLPGVIVNSEPTRIYPHGSLASQILGYTREITPAQLDNYGRERYRPGDVVGQSGLETFREEDLRGEPGYIQVEVDARGRRRDELGIIDTKSGDDLYLTLDLDLQKIVEEQFVGKKGAAIALDPRTGEVLVLVSAPSYDPNVFAGQVSKDVWDSLVSDPGKPFRNRAISAAYPPGSTSKLMWALVGLQEGKINANSSITCPGYYKIKGHTFHCHKRSGHGHVSLSDAIKVSCNAFFYQLGDRLGIDVLGNYLDKFGFGKNTGIDISGEETGTAPSKKWKLDKYGERWYNGDTLPVSIGQGYFTATPLQMASMLSTIVMQGKRFKPHLVSKVIHSQTGSITTIEPELLSDLKFKKEYVDLVMKSGQRVIEEPGGTGKRAAIKGVSIGGKTGTAQVAAVQRGIKGLLNDHAWFIAYAPVENPTIVLAIIVENGGHGGETAAPIAKLMLEKYFRKQGLIPEENLEVASVKP